MKNFAKEGNIVFISLNTSSADNTNNRALFGIMGSVGGGGDRPLQHQPNRRNSRVNS